MELSGKLNLGLIKERTLKRRSSVFIAKVIHFSQTQRACTFWIFNPNVHCVKNLCSNNCYKWVFFFPQ